MVTVPTLVVVPDSLPLTPLHGLSPLALASVNLPAETP
jgi:hypothetical protein